MLYCNISGLLFIIINERHFYLAIFYAVHLVFLVGGMAVSAVLFAGPHMITEVGGGRGREITKKLLLYVNGPQVQNI